MAAGTRLAHNHDHLHTRQVPTVEPDRRQLTEDDADYVRLHAGTVKRLEASIAQYARELRATGGDAHRMAEASSRFVRRHTAILRTAYELAHREGVRDYFAATSQTAKLPHVAPDPTAERKQMAFYAPSVARMAAEGLRTYQETLREGKAVLRASVRDTEAVRLADARQSLGDWQQSLAPRVALQAEIVWPAMSDGYLRGGSADVGRPFSRVWWRLGPVKTQHCDDCPLLAFNSPYGAPGSGDNELWQVPGDGRTACGAGCKCSLELGWEEMPASGNYDWTDFFPPDMYQPVNAPQRSPTSEQGTGGLLPGDVARGPIAVDANGDYVYGGTSAEGAYYAQMSPHDTPYGALSVLPPPSTLAGLDAGEIHAMDDFRSAWFHWDAVRGELPPAPTLFGAETAPMLQALTKRRYLVRGQFPAWDALTTAQQRALQEVYDAVLEWNAARSGLDAADVEEGSLAGVGMSEPREWVQVVALRNDDHSNHGKFTYTGGPGSQGGRAEGEGEEGRVGGRAGGAHEAEHTASRAIGGQRKYTGAKLGPAQRAQQERGLAEDRAQLLKVEHALGQHDAFLAGHEATHPDYERISEQRMRLASAHEALQERINAREDLLGMERSARRERPPMPEPRGTAAPKVEAKTPSPKAAEEAKVAQRRGKKLPKLKKSYVEPAPRAYRPRPSLKDMTPEERAAYRVEKQREAAARFRARHPERQAQYWDQPGKREQHAAAMKAWRERNLEEQRAKTNERVKRIQARKRAERAAARAAQQQSEQMHEQVLPWLDAWELRPDPALVRLVEAGQ